LAGRYQGNAAEVQHAICTMILRRLVITRWETIMARETGTVERFMDEKGFGFIKPDNGGKDVFVHHSAIQGSGYKSLKPGTRVEYEIQQDPKGPRADNVVPVEE
jgi:CspA family cold shock protein